MSCLKPLKICLHCRGSENMTVVTIAVVGITAVLLAVALKGMKGEYGIYLVMAAGFFIFFYGVGKLTTILDTIKQVQSYIKINSVYLSTLIKMIGITYVAVSYTHLDVYKRQVRT